MKLKEMDAVALDTVSQFGHAFNFRPGSLTAVTLAEVWPYLKVFSPTRVKLMVDTLRCAQRLITELAANSDGLDGIPRELALRLEVVEEWDHD